MKINKYFLGLAVAIMGGLTSCNTDVEGEYYHTGLDNVSFDVASKALSVPVEQSTATIPVVVTRGNVAAAYAAKYEATASAAGIFSDDGNGVVNFEAGQGTATINVKAANLEKEVPYTYTLKLSEADIATADTITKSQISTITITVQREGDWTEWKKWNSTGTADYYYSGFFFSGDDPDLPFLYRQSVTSPNNYQLKVQKWGNGVELIMNYDSSTGEVYVPETFTGYVHSTYGNIYIADFTNYSAQAPKGYFDTQKGIIALSVYYYDAEGPWNAGYEYLYIDGYVRADYTISSLTYAGIFTDPQQNVFAVGALELAADAKNVKAVVVSADADAEAVADAIAAGELEATDVEAGNIYVPIAEGLTGKLQMVVVSLDAEGTVASIASAAFEYYGGGANPWKSLGIGYFTDNLLTSFFGPDENTAYDPQTYEVEILENSDEPGLYRLVNAFQGAAEYMGYSAYYTPTDIEVNATVADGVYIEAQLTGLSTYATGTYGGYALQSYDFATLYQYGYFGWLEDGVMTFPVFSVKDKETGEVKYTYQGLVTTPDAKNYYSGINPTAETQLKIVLPTAAASVKAAARRSANATAFANRLNSYAVKGHEVVKHDKAEMLKLASKKVKKQKFQKGF
ncbi:MAG: hypothetical protein II404_14240 [Prevotella sp.]|nr:hypothetical protein [Prevotella sp.]